MDRTYGYPVPYRCFYSRNIENLFMAGRCISVTHEALGTVRVMKTCGMMGEVVGKAASICTLHDCYPRDVYNNYLDELKNLVRLPGKARRATVFAKIEMPKVIPTARPEGPASGKDPTKMQGIVVDDIAAEKTGSWTNGTGLKGYVGYGYLYAGNGSGASIRFAIKAPKDGEYELRLHYGNHPNRAPRAPVVVLSGDKRTTMAVDMKKAPEEDGAISLGRFSLKGGQTTEVVIGTENAGGTVHADAVQLLPLP